MRIALKLSWTVEARAEIHAGTHAKTNGEGGEEKPPSKTHLLRGGDKIRAGLNSVSEVEEKVDYVIRTISPLTSTGRKDVDTVMSDAVALLTSTKGGIKSAAVRLTSHSMVAAHRVLSCARLAARLRKRKVLDHKRTADALTSHLAKQPKLQRMKMSTKKHSMTP